VLRIALLLLALLAGCRTAPRANGPLERPRLIAEWEPAIGAMVAWPLYVPDTLVQEIAQDDLLFVLAKPEHVEAARSRMAALGIAAEQLRFVPCSVESSWPRDWGPHQLFERDGAWTLVDHLFDGWPYYPRDPAPDGAAPAATFVFRQGPGDDLVVGELADHLAAPVLELPLHLTGGNFLVDGAGTAFCTRAQIFENEPLGPEAAFHERVRELLGIERVVVLENTEPVGIQHIDCWLKVLDEERLLVKRAPAGHPEEEPLERNVALLARLENARGRPYEILRIDCPQYPGRTLSGRSPPIAAYTNSLILNRKVLVPLFGIPGDADALATWRAAMPGHRVIGFEWDRWQYFDALHCRVRAVFDRAAPASGAGTSGER
jgi:agmatine/peptidylarginine deiminase